jgi:RNA methyltransferase, TrmH family
LNRLALLKSTEEVMGIFHYPRFEFAHKRDLNFTLYLCDIKDPGNLGTIIRTADWFGVSQLFATKGTVDFLNNKVIQATMSSISRVQITTINPLDLKQLLPDYEWYGTT